MTIEPASADPLREDQSGLPATSAQSQRSGERSRPEATSSRLDASRRLREKSHIGWYWWLLWPVLLAIGMFIFYVLFTPVWIGIRLAAWVSERSPRRRS
jgi:hypothetical protein